MEFGAADGVKLSNTYLLETKYGWRGIVAEPNPKFIPKVKASRKCYVSDKCLFSRSGEKVAFLPAAYGELSRMRDIVPEDSQEAAGRRLTENTVEVMVETISLNDLLLAADAPSDIDFMSIDTEGSELEILSHFDFDRWNVKTICVEHNSTPLRALLYELLLKNGYRRKWEHFSRFDDWYVKS